MAMRSSAPVRPLRSALRAALCTGALIVATATAAVGQPATPELAQMRDELRRLHEEVSALRAEVAALRRGEASGHPSAAAALGTPPASPVAGAEAPPLRTQAEQRTPEAFEIVKAQVEEQAQSKVESLSKMPVRLYGTILSNTVVNSREANWLENPNLVNAPPSGVSADGSMTSTLRQSRIGLDVGVIPVGSLRASGTLVMDFLGGVPNFNTGTVMGLPRLIIAYGRLDGDTLGLQVGQDTAMLAPRDPTSLAARAFPLFFRSGNLYLRAPQARVEYRPTAGWAFKTGIVAPIAGDFASGYEFAPAAGAGERSRRPAFEAHAGYGRGDADSPSELAIGASGHYGWRRGPDGLDETWAGAIDGNIRFGRVGVAGEWFMVDNGEMFGAAVNQAGRAHGGWIEGRVTVTRSASINGGFGLDRPRDARGRLVRAENRSAFANTIWNLTPELAVSVEYRWLETRLGLVPINRRNHHVNAAFAVSF